MKAKKKPLAVIKGADVGVELDGGLEIVSVEEPGKREGGKKVESVDEVSLNIVASRARGFSLKNCSTDSSIACLL